MQFEVTRKVKRNIARKIEADKGSVMRGLETDLSQGPHWRPTGPLERRHPNTLLISLEKAKQLQATGDMGMVSTIRNLQEALERAFDATGLKGATAWERPKNVTWHPIAESATEYDKIQLHRKLRGEFYDAAAVERCFNYGR